MNTGAHNRDARMREDPADLVGAYALDALPESERVAFERFLATDDPSAMALRREVAELRAAVGVLAHVLDDAVPDAASLAEQPLDADGLAGPSPELRGRLLDAVRADLAADTLVAWDRDAAADGVDSGTVTGDAAGPTAAARSPRTSATAGRRAAVGAARDQARARGGSRRPSGSGRPLGSGAAVAGTGAPIEPTPLRPPRRILPARGDGGGGAPGGRLGRLPTILSGLAAVLALAALGTGAWALNLRGELDDREERIAQLQEEIGLANMRANATSFTLSATPQGPDGVQGSLFYSGREETVVLTISGLPAPPPGRAYQLWYLSGREGEQPIPAGTFTIDDSGRGYLTMSDVEPGSFSQIAITEEPEGGSPQPTSDVLVIGQVSAAG